MSGSVGARITRRSGSSFYYAFRILSREKRRAVFALYAFCRVVDDCVDEPDGEGEAGLERWLAEVRRCYAGRPQTELGRELAETVARFPIPRSCFEDVVAGCRMDVGERRYATWDELRVYCERVASAVGLASIEIFGYEDPATRRYAVELGLALQLTNILRDIAPDLERGRLYLPLEDLGRFAVGEEEIRAQCLHPAPPRSAALSALLAFEADRARQHYAAAAASLPAVDRRSMLAAQIMGAVYRALLEEWERRGHPIGGARVSLSKPRKAWIALRSVPRACWRA
ncbi:MAG TPA: presqualene diphosphate synthase HpnD [Vicinamibacteria bacterium]|nr:presqualene diphosphate synthase HpnD [Vicinamibacteria bacterium]